MDKKMGMKKIYLYCLSISIVCGLTSFINKKTNWICVPGIHVGAINSSSSEENLIHIFGKKNVLRSKIDIGEGTNAIGTVVFPNTKNELQIIWKDTINFTHPNYIYVRNKKSNWVTNTNIKIGTSLKKLEKINKNPFNLLGFGWDYSGTISNWNGGILEANNNPNSNKELIVRLENTAKDRLLKSEYNTLIGDKEILSSNILLQKINPKVVCLVFIFNE